MKSKIDTTIDIIEVTDTPLTTEITNNTDNARLSPINSRLPKLNFGITDPAQKRAAGNIVKFLAVLVVVTLIARGTSSATLAKVDVSTPSRGEIVESVTGTATVSVKDTLDITVPEGLTIEEMFVGAGQKINSGDAVAQFDMEEVAEMLTRETASLDKLLLDLEKLERTERTDSTSLENAKKNLQRAQEDYNDTKTANDEDVADAQSDLDEAIAAFADEVDTASLDNARRNLQRAQDDYDSVKAQGIADVAEANDALNEVKAEGAEAVDATALENAQRNLRRAQEDRDSTIADSDAEIWAAQDALSEAESDEYAKYKAWKTADAADEAAAKQAYISAQAKTEQAWNTLSTVQSKADNNILNADRKVEDAVSSLEKAEKDYNKSVQQINDSFQSDVDKAVTALETAESKANDNLLSAQRKIEDAESSLAKAESDYYKNIEQASEAVQNEIDKCRTALESAKSKARDSLLSAQRKVDDAQTSLSKAEQDYSKSAQQTADTSAQNEISAASLRLDVAAQKKTVEDLQLMVKNEGIVYTGLSGTVATAKADGSVSGKDPIVSFLDGSKGFEASLQLSKSDAEKLAVGEEYEVSAGGSSMYYNPTVTGVVSSISASDDNDKVTLAVRLPDGDWTVGQRVEVQAVQGRDTYEQCVPLTALHSDNSGYFLLTVEQKVTVLGVENVVVKTAVTITASDDDNAAVRGAFDRSSKVITSSDKAVEAGDRVRINT